jgi:predicted SAM-dependent methyltransferase
MKIDFGAGPHPRTEADVFVDFHKWREDYVQHDLTVFPYPFDDNCADKIYFYDTIEHINIFEIDVVLKEFKRILKDGAKLELTTPDLDWICERIYKKDWKEATDPGWLTKHENSDLNAVSYLFGGFMEETEYNMKGMGHICAYNFDLLKALLEKHDFYDIERVEDFRNTPLNRKAVLKVICKCDKD